MFVYHNPRYFTRIVIGIIGMVFGIHHLYISFYDILIGRALGNNTSLDYMCFQGIDAIKSGIGK